MACRSVQNCELLCCGVAEAFVVPYSTLHYRVTGRILPGCQSGPQHYLTDSELVNFLVGCASVGYAKSRKQVIAHVQSIVASNVLL